MSENEHFSVDFAENAEGWWVPRCMCEWEGGPCPTAEDACDALMDHAYESGVEKEAAERERWRT